VSDSALLAYDQSRGVRFIAGVDEVGRACLAGPITAAGILFDLERLRSDGGIDRLEELDDSKRLGRAKRERLALAVLAHADAFALVFIPASQIDRIGIDRANVACLEQALRAVGGRADLRLVDGRLALGAGALEHKLIVRGDATSAVIAAASIVAKVARDRFMVRLGQRYPGYGFERNAGYWTKEHVAAIARLRPTPEHRLSFKSGWFPTAGVPAPAQRSKPGRASWRGLPDSEKASHLLETPTISDRVWTDQSRVPGETRAAFIRRVLLGETTPVEASEGGTAAT
jgi:ribonuclease HII